MIPSSICRLVMGLFRLFYETEMIMKMSDAVTKPAILHRDRIRSRKRWREGKEKTEKERE